MSGGRISETSSEFLGRGVVTLAVQFRPNGTGAVTLSNSEKRKGLKSVTRTGVGSFTLQFDRNYTGLLSVSGMVQSTSATSTCWALNCGAFTANATGGSTLAVRLYANNVLSDMASGANEKVILSLNMSRSSVWK
jgi:hypothetical protein